MLSALRHSIAGPEFLGALEVERHGNEPICQSYGPEKYQTLATRDGKTYGDLVLTGHIIRCKLGLLEVI